MKISKLPEWIADNWFPFVMAGVVIFFISLMVFTMRPDFEKQKLLPAGTEVIVKGTDIHGTVIRWFPNDEVLVEFVTKDGTVKSVQYNYNLLKKQ